MSTKARKRSKAGEPEPAAPPPDPDARLDWLPPARVPHPDFPAVVWTSVCGRYRVTRTVAAAEGEHWAFADSFAAEYAATLRTAPFDGRGNRLTDAAGVPLKTGPVRTIWEPVERRSVEEGGERKRYRSLLTAATACLTFHVRRAGRHDVQTNVDVVLAAAEPDGLATLPRRGPPPAPTPVAVDLPAGSFGLVQVWPPENPDDLADGD